MLAFRQPDAEIFQLTDNAWAFSTCLSAAECDQNKASCIWVGFGSGLSATSRKQISTDKQGMGVQYMLICRRVRIWVGFGSVLSATRRRQISADNQRMGVQYVLIWRRVRAKPGQPHLGRFWLWLFGNQTQTDFN